MIVKCLPRAVQLSPFKCSSGTSTEIIANDQKVKGNAGKAEEKEKRKKRRMENTKTQQERKCWQRKRNHSFFSFEKHDVQKKLRLFCRISEFELLFQNLKTFQAQVLLFCQYCPCTGRRQYRRTNTKTNGHTTPPPPITTINTL